MNTACKTTTTCKTIAVHKTKPETLKSKKAYLKKLLQRHRIVPLAPKDKARIIDIFDAHYLPVGKERRIAGADIADVRVVKHTSYGTYSFELELHNSYRTTFSIKRLYANAPNTSDDKCENECEDECNNRCENKCNNACKDKCTSECNSALELLSRSLRFAVRDQTDPLRDLAFKKYCKKGEVDHAKTPFYELRDDFLKQEGLQPEDVALKYDMHLRVYRLCDIELENRWKKYHKNKATLQWVSHEENWERYLQHLEEKRNKQP